MSFRKKKKNMTKNENKKKIPQKWIETINSKINKIMKEEDWTKNGNWEYLFIYLFDENKTREKKK